MKDYELCFLVINYKTPLLLWSINLPSHNTNLLTLD